MKENPGISLRPNPDGDWPQVAPTAYIDLTAQIIGNVRIDAQVFIGPNAVIRADEADDNGKVLPIEIGAECNVQDGVIIHALGGTKVTIGRRTSLAHGCIIHGPCTLGENCFIGFRVVIYDATLGDEVFIGAGAVIQGVELCSKALVPPGVSILSREHLIKLASTTDSVDREFIKKVKAANIALAKGYIELEKQKQKTLDC